MDTPATHPNTTTTSTNPNPKSASTPQTTHLTLTHHRGTIFTAPPHTILIQACNTQGSWGAGIALAFRSQYPSAYTIYRKHCTQLHDPKKAPVPTGTCLLIPPTSTSPSTTDEAAKQHWIACLFTSARYGRGKDMPETILANTHLAMRDLLKQIEVKTREGVEIGGLWMCRINSGRFGVEWGRTVGVLEGIEISGEDGVKEVEVWSLDED